MPSADLQPEYSLEDFAVAFPGENDRIEFKSGTGSQPLQEAAVAFSNTSGGFIFVGVNDDGVVIGRPLDQGTNERINQALLQAFDLGRYQTHEIGVGGKRVSVISVSERSEGFSQTSDGRTLVRRGPRNQFLIGTELQAFISERALRRFESAQSALLIDEVEPGVLADIARIRGWDVDHDDIAARLRERGLARDNNLTIAGALMLTHPSESLELQKCVVEVRRYPREGVDYDRREVFGGPLQDQVRRASEFVSAELGSDLVVSGLYRYDLPKLPEVVVREAIANAVAHRSYEIDRTPVVIELRDDRVVVRSPGGLPEPVTIETMRAAQAARNPVIIEVLRAFSLAEDAGRGVDVMQDSMRDALLDAPMFADQGGFVTVTLPLRGPITPRERGWVQELERQGQLNPEDRLLAIHAARGESLSNASAREILGTQDSGEARRILQRLRDVGVLIQTGERGSARYTLSEEIAPPAAYRMNTRQLARLIVEEALERPISNSDVRSITGFDSRAAGALLNQLLEQGLLERFGERRGTRYRAT